MQFIASPAYLHHILYRCVKIYIDSSKFDGFWRKADWPNEGGRPFFELLKSPTI
jgi:hypothetical protein